MPQASGTTARRRSDVHPVTTAAVLVAPAVAAATNLLFVVAVGVGARANAGVPGIIGVEGTETAASAGSIGLVLLVGTSGRAVVAVLELADLVVEPTDDTAGGRPWRTVGILFFMPW